MANRRARYHLSFEGIAQMADEDRFAHECHDGHVSVGHFFQVGEPCPLCYAVSALNHIKELAGRGPDHVTWPQLAEIGRRAKATLLKLEA